MKIAVSSASFATLFSGGVSQLEWLDACANEFEVDGVVLDLAHFPRTDADYLAQLKKSAIDLGLSIAAVSCPALPDDDAFALALALGAPIAIGFAPPATDDAGAWNAFVDAAKTCARAAKRANVVVALGRAAGTLCADGASLRRITYDFDGSWLRFAFDPLDATAETTKLLPKSAIARATFDDAATFATAGNVAASDILKALARFRGFVVLACANATASHVDMHDAIARFTAARAVFLQHGLEAVVKT